MTIDVAPGINSRGDKPGHDGRWEVLRHDRNPL